MTTWNPLAGSRSALRSTLSFRSTTSYSPMSSSSRRPARTWSISIAAIRHAPDLCVEILSPSTEVTDRGRKLQMFARYGVPEYWIVDPAHEVIEIHRLEGSGYVLAQRASGEDEVRSPVLPGARAPRGKHLPLRHRQERTCEVKCCVPASTSRDEPARDTGAVGEACSHRNASEHAVPIARRTQRRRRVRRGVTK